MAKLTGPSFEKKGENNNNAQMQSKPNNQSDDPLTESEFARKCDDQTPKSNNSRKKQSEFSDSIKSAVENAAETARLVLDQAAKDVIAEEASRGRKGSFSSHSNQSRRSQSPSNRLASEDGMSLSGGEEEEEELEEQRRKHKKEWFESNKVANGGGRMTQPTGDGSSENNSTSGDHSLPNAEIDELEVQKAISSISNDEDMDESIEIGKFSISDMSDSRDTVKEAEIIGSSPPPGAFQNLPMMRGIPPSNPGIGGGGERGSGLTGGRLTEVTNHFEVAAAVSAALASSHLVQTTGGVGGLQMPKSTAHQFYPVKKGASRRSSEKGDGDNDDEESNLTPPRKLVEPKTQFSHTETSVNTPDEEKSSTSGSEESDMPAKKTLPTPEEALTEVAARRLSFISDDEEVEQLPLNTQKVTQLAKSSSGEAMEKDENVENDDKHFGSVDAAGTNEEYSDIGEKSLDDSISYCSSNGYDNESNSSSMFGSDISPITMSMGSGGGSSNQGNNSKGGGGGNGMIGKMTNSRGVVVQENTTNYDAGTDDEYSMHSDIMIYNGRNNLAPHKHQLPTGESNKEDGALPSSKDYAPKSMTTALTPSTKPLRMFDSGDASIQTEVTEGSKKQKKIAAPQDNNASNVRKQPSAESRHSMSLPAHQHQHHIPLFESFDRNWDQSLQGNPFSEKELAIGRKCLAAFAMVFGECNDISSYDAFDGKKGDSKMRGHGGVSLKDSKASKFHWWVDDDANGSSMLDNTTDTNNPDETNSNDTEEFHHGIPRVVVRSLWKACFFDSEDVADTDVDAILDSIEHVLLNDLCYLTTVSTPSASCLRLSLDIYAEYGCYILRRYLSAEFMGVSVEEEVATWHSKFASVLHQILLNNDKSSDSDSMTLRRYAARSLPRHKAFGILGVDSHGCFYFEPTIEKRVQLRTDVFKNLLCNSDFVKSRAELLGRGHTRPDSIDETLGADNTNSHFVASIKQTRDNDMNLLLPTLLHLKDIEWCAPFCSVNSDLEPSDCDGESVTPNCRASSVCDCLDALMIWRKECIVRFSLLYDSGKVTIYDNASGKSTTASQSAHKSETPKPPAKLILSYNGTDRDKPVGVMDNCIEVAKSLLAREDAWTMKDNSCQILKNCTSKEDKASRKLQRKGRRKRSDDTTEPTLLAKIVRIDINDIRTAISIGRSLLSLSEFSHYALEKEVFTKKRGTSSMTSRLRQEQAFCLNDSIQVFSFTAITLVYILSSAFEKLDEDDLDETVLTSFGPTHCLQKFALAREAAKPLLTVTGILSADAWYSLGTLVNETSLSGKSAKMSNNVSSKQAMLSSFERALLVLGSSKSNSMKKANADSLLSPLTQYKCFLQSSINHAVGVILYELGIFDKAAGYLNEAIRFRRELLEDLNSSADQSSRLTTLLNSFVGAVKNSSAIFSSPAFISDDIFLNELKYSISHSCVLLPKQRIEKSKCDDLELSLSLTLEYAALTQHAAQSYQTALSFFQEALILRTMHVGKSSLDVASLHFNMGVVHDDLEQYEAAISRYNESLRIRTEQLNNASPSRHIAELEDSVLLTLKCMGHVYKVVNDMDNAVPCYVRVLEMLTKKMITHRNAVDEWTRMGLRLTLAVPVPTVIVNDMKKNDTDEKIWRQHFQAINKKALCHQFSESEYTESPKSRSASMVSKLKKELIKIHSTVIALIHQKKHNTTTRSTTSRLPVTSVLLSPGGDAFESALMNSSFSLGRIRLEQGRYDEAADQLEVSLRSKWVLDPTSSSDSDSDFSYKTMPSRRKQPKCISEEDPEEGQIYYALGMSNAAMDDHERAVRCFMTALRYLRRNSRMVDSLEVARVLFDTATSYYYVCDFEQAVSHWNDCLRILKSHDGTKDSSLVETNTEKSLSRQGIVLYCLALARSAIEEEYQPETIHLLNEARSLLSSSKDKTIIAYLDFLTGHFLYHTASQIPIRLRSQLPTSIRLSPSLIDDLSWDEMCTKALSLFEKVKHSCWFDPSKGVEDVNEIKNLPLSAHLCLKRGQVYELTGAVEEALDSYMDAINFYRIACGHDNVYAASVLHYMGMLCAHSQGNDKEHHALGFFNEALATRKNILGGNDRRVADSLYCSAIVLARLNRYESSMERYHEALRIQMSVVGQGSKEVAMTLSGMGLCHYSHRAYDLALTCLAGALKVRKHRISHLMEEAEQAKTTEINFGVKSKSVKSLHFVKLENVYDEEVALGVVYFNLGNVHMQLGDYGQAMQNFIQARDLRWRHVGGGSTDKILDRYLFGSEIDEDELLGLAHCLHNIGVLFDIKKEYQRSLPHYEEALAIKNAIAGYGTGDSTSLLAPVVVDPNENEALVLKSLDEDTGLPEITKATLSAAMTRQKMASVYAKQKKFELALFHYSHALRIQRQVLGRDHFITSLLLTNMGNVLRRTTTRHSETAIMCYNESLRISRLRFGPDHERVASALFNLGGLYDSRRNFDKAVHYYHRALLVYKSRYAQDLRRRLCTGFDTSSSRRFMEEDESGPLVLSTGDEIVLNNDSPPQKQIQKQYMLVTKALRNATRQDIIQNGGAAAAGYSGTYDWWITFEAMVFQFVEMLSSYVVDPTNTAVRNTIEFSRDRIENAAHHAIITAKDALDYNFLLLMQE